MSTTLAEKLLNHQETPPPAAWQNIVQALNKSNDQIPFADKLQAYEVAPPPQAWSLIAAELQKKPLHKPAVIKRFSAVYRMSAAAIVVGIICVAGFYIFSTRSSNQQMAPLTAKSNPGTPKQGSPAISNIIRKAVPPPPLAILRKATAAISRKRKKYYAKIEEEKLPNAAVDRLSFADTLISIMVNTKLIRNEKGAVIQNLSLLNNGDNPSYISITSPNGEQTKISSKFLNSLLYLRDNNYLDNFHGYVDKSFLESLAWKLKFESWRKKLLETPFIPSSYNYLDIFEFKELISKDN